ncbi:hypothetical protein ABPG75_008529 [Micractinium tetrahymenae]
MLLAGSTSTGPSLRVLLHQLVVCMQPRPPAATPTAAAAAAAGDPAGIAAAAAASAEVHAVRSSVATPCTALLACEQLGSGAPFLAGTTQLWPFEIICQPTVRTPIIQQMGRHGWHTDALPSHAPL